MKGRKLSSHEREFFEIQWNLPIEKMKVLHLQTLKFSTKSEQCESVSGLTIIVMTIHLKLINFLIDDLWKIEMKQKKDFANKAQREMTKKIKKISLRWEIFAFSFIWHNRCGM